jgi:hypothetical protein
MATTHPLVKPRASQPTLNFNPWPNPYNLPCGKSTGLTHHVDELQTFIAIRNIDIMLISETHFTHKSYLKNPH